MPGEINRVAISSTIDLSSAAKRGYVETPTLNPHTGAPVNARIAQDKLLGFAYRGPSYKFHQGLQSVRAVLADPEFVLEYKEEDWTGYCYARRLAEVPDRNGRNQPCEEGFTFLVFVTKDFKVIEWGLEPCDRWQRPGMPANVRNGEMGVVLWPKK